MLFSIIHNNILYWLFLLVVKNQILFCNYKGTII
jgi:hypothetical protein